jgi:hypothetical protein
LGFATTLNDGTTGDVPILSASTFDGEEVESLDRIGVQPIDSRAVFLAKRLGNPDYSRPAILPRYVRQYLPEMGMIGRTKLVLDNDDCATDITREYIDEEVADRDLGTLRL